MAFERAVSHTPVLAAVISDPDGGSLEGRFYARHAGASSWNIIDAAAVPVASGQTARTTLPALPAGAVVEWTVKACDVSACSAAAPTQAAKVSPMLGAGQRKNATAMSFQLGDRVDAQVDVGTGNLLVSSTGLSVLGVSGDLDVGMAYNSLSLGADVPQADASSAAGVGWTQSVGQGTRLEEADDGSVIYWGPSGLSGMFVPGSGGAFTPPAGFTADLVETSSGWTLTDHASQQKLKFDADGRLVEAADRNGNTTTIAYNPYAPAIPLHLTGSAGPNDARKITVTSSGGRVTGLSQTGNGSTRTVTYGYNSANDLTTITDALGRVTTFTYDAHRLVKAVAPGGTETRFTFDARNRVTSVRQVNSSAGSPGDTWTRLAYPSATQVLVSDGAQEQAGSPTSGPRTTYTLTEDNTGRVAEAVDAEGRTRSSTFTANMDPLTSSLGAGSTAQTTTNTFGANNGESLTGQASQSGAEAGWEYENTDPATKYLPTSGTDDSGNTSLFTYNGAGNMMSSTDAMAAEAVLTRNSNGTVATATAPGNGSNKTSYGYNSLAQMTSITPVTGASLGARAMTYDKFGRLATETNGRGVTTTYTYDAGDRVLGIDYSGTSANPDVAFTYDSAGRVATRADAAGTTTYGYDRMSRLTSRVNSYDNKTITYGYDKASRLASVTDTRGTSTHHYDTAGAQTELRFTLPSSSVIRTTRFAVDDKGRRTDTWMLTNANNTVWAAHSHTDYDSSGRPSRIWADRNAPSTTAGDPTRVMDLRYCYAAGSTAPSCSTDPGADRSFVQWTSDEITGQVTTYTYDGARRLTGATRTAGTDADNNPIPAVSYTYTYDNRGNRTGQTITTGTGSSATTSTQTRTHNAANQTTNTGFTYDGAGNMTNHPQAGVIAYNAGDQMKSVTRNGVTNDYVYAGTGHTELLAHEVPGKGTYKYTYGRNNAIGQPVIEQVTINNGTAYLENDASGTPIMLRSSAGMHALYIYDNLGSPAASITTANSTAFTYKFDPYGAPELTEDSGGLGVPQTPFIFTGGLNDRTTGWVLNGARYYDPSEGRWTQHDTLDAPLDPSNANRYAYAANNPANYIDPLGTVTMGGVVGAVVGTVVGTIGAAALCAGTGGIGCAAAAGAFFGGISGMVAGGLEAKIDGGDVRQGAIDGGVYGAITGGLSSVARLIPS